MSYDLTFLRKDDAQSWDEALEALEERVGEDADAGPPDAQAWAHIVAEAQQLLGDVELHQNERFFELDHEPTGIQLALYGDGAGITVPYWYAGAKAEAIIELIYQLGLSVERHTPLVGYDPQLELAVAEAAHQPQLAVAIFDQVAQSFARPRDPEPER